MQNAVLIPLMYAGIGLVTGLFLWLVPQKDKNQALKRAMRKDSFIQGGFGLLVALVSALLRLEDMTAMYILVGGMIVISGVVMVPTLLTAGRENKGA